MNQKMKSCDGLEKEQDVEKEQEQQWFLPQLSGYLITIIFVYSLGFVCGVGFSTQQCVFLNGSSGEKQKYSSLLKHSLPAAPASSSSNATEFTKLPQESTEVIRESRLLSLQALPSSGSSHAATSSGTLPRAKFVFLVGSEGTGHHFFSKLYRSSPSFFQLKRWGLLEENSLIYRLQRALFSVDDKDKGLFSATSAIPSLDINGTHLVERVADYMQRIDSEVSAAAAKGATKTAATGKTVTVPLNTFPPPVSRTTGMMSYPNFGGTLQYPDLSLMYHACRRASVQCQHIVIYRNPYEIIRSTTANRKYLTLRVAVKLFATMLAVIHGQIMDEAEGLAACWDYNDPSTTHDVATVLGWNSNSNSNSDSNNNNNNSSIDTSTESFEKTFSELYHPPSAIGWNERNELVPPTMRIFMDTMIKGSERVKKACREQLLRNKNLAQLI